MSKNALVRGLLWSVLATSVVACSSDDAPIDAPPASIDSGFSFQSDAFSFANFGGNEQAPQLTPGLVARMFGPEQVCAFGTMPCTLNPVAEAWMHSANGTLAQGRSEGFAITSLLFHSGELDPNDFGAETVAELRLAGNIKLQEELAYWAAMQGVPSAVDTNERYEAKDVIPFLTRALDPESDKHYRLAIAQRTETGFARGHALTPIGYFRDRNEVYWLRVYDNNFPNSERRIAINPAANTWRYEVPPIDEGDETIVYEGNSENGNVLYFAAVEDRLGVLQAPFAADSQVRTLSYSSVALVAKVGDRETGIRDGEILEAEGDRVMPAFSRCARCGRDVPIINQTLIAQGVRRDAIEIESEGVATVRTGQGDSENTIGLVPGDGEVDWITATSPGATSTAYPQGDTSFDSVSFSEDGSVSYTANSGEGVTVSTQIDRGDGVFEEVTLEVEGSGDPNTPLVLRVVTDEEGGARIEVENLPEGKAVTVSVKRSEDGENRHVEEIVYTSSGDTSTVTFGNDDNESAELTNANDLERASCENGAFDPSIETDVDCGGDCAPCADALICEANEDCEGGACVAEFEFMRCRSVQCTDGILNGDQTDVDCGGSVCDPCRATSDQETTPLCLVDSDCNTGLCIEDRCRIAQPVIVRANRLPQVGIYLRYELDGRAGSRHLQSDQTEGPFEFVIGEAYRYQVTESQQCAIDFTPQITGLSSPQDQEPYGYIDVDCPEEGFLSINGRVLYDLGDGTPPLAADNPVTLWLTIDGEETEVEMSGTSPSSQGFFEESWEAVVKSNPSQPTADNRYYECDIFPGYASSGTDRRSQILVECDLSPPPTCSDGRRNQDESAVDCGGSCAPCNTGASCWVDGDCLTGAFCIDRVCTSDGSTCTDGIQNQDETDLDCGGQRCGPCVSGESCLVAMDCTSGVCDGNVCAAPACDDGVLNQDESDLDCGGTTCSPCDVGQTCNGRDDCLSLRCSDVNGCEEATCSDNLQNQDESDIDCGGASCAACAIGDTCTQPSDCASNACSGGLCVGSCTDGIQNQDEVGIDCGGSFCVACPSGAACTLDSDCPSANCECAANSGDCTGDSGQCGGPKLVADLPTTDGVATSATLSVPAGCPEVYVQAWGAAGGAGSMGGGGGGGFGTPGGAGGYVSGYLTVAAGDVLDVWVGQGGDFGTGSSLGGDPSIGSKYGVATRGGFGDGGAFAGGGGSGGGLTSVEVRGSNPTSFLVPAGGGGTAFGEGEDVAFGFGGGATDSNGESAPIGSEQAGGGAGEEGGSSANTMGSGGAGTYGTYPAGFSTADGSLGVPANTTAPDYQLCLGLSGGAIGAGSNDGTSGFDAGGDGCVILRCVAP